MYRFLPEEMPMRFATFLPSSGFGLLSGSEAGLKVAKSLNSLAMALVT